jgi:hypothetical protein
MELTGLIFLNGKEISDLMRIKEKITWQISLKMANCPSAVRRKICNYGPDCVRRKHHRKPVLYCEEFDDYQAVPKKPFRAFGDYDAREKFVTSRLASASSMGLCPFCDNQGTCANSDRDGGVWHCEEYR